MKNQKKLTLYGQLCEDLEECLGHAKGELTLVTTELPAPPPETEPKKIVSLRKAYKMSQAVFAGVLNVSVKTIQSWEQGIREPSDSALRLLEVIQIQPDLVEKIILPRKSSLSKTRKSGKKTRVEKRKAI